MQKVNRPKKPDWFNENFYKKNRKEFFDKMLQITNYHCYYTDKNTSRNRKFRPF